MIDQDTTWMQRALSLARRGIGVSSPNPAVGCVILDCAGQLAGEGWHEYDLLDHAEVVALKAAGERARGGTAYVTLEPCNHTGRTPPCTEALIAAGMKRVVAATIDPNPAVAGHGMEALHAAGQEVLQGVCQAEARRLNEGFARWSQHHRPFVLMKVAMTLDGRIAPPAGVQEPRQPYWITSEAARAAVQPLRHQADAVLTGVDTVLADDPLLTDRSGLPRRRPLLRVVLDSALRMPLDSRMVTSAMAASQSAENSVLPPQRQRPAAEGSSLVSGHDFSRAESDAKSTGPQQVAEKLGLVSGHDFSRAESSPKLVGALAPAGKPSPESRSDLVIFTISTDDARIQPLRSRGVRVVVLPPEAGRVPLGKVLDKLGVEGILTLLTESGTRLNTALLTGNLVDRVHLFLSPQIMGSDAVPAFRGIASPIRMAEVQVERYGNDLGLCSLLRDPWLEIRRLM